MLVYLVLAIVAVAIASMNASRALLMQRSTTLWQAYCSQLKKRPLLTKAATGTLTHDTAGMVLELMRYLREVGDCLSAVSQIYAQTSVLSWLPDMVCCYGMTVCRHGTSFASLLLGISCLQVW
jgi:hypothetical protein